MVARQSHQGPGCSTRRTRTGSKLIATQPEVGAKAQNAKLASVRRILIRRVRYHLYYRLVGSSNPSVEVLAVWHASRGRGPGV
jgi:plasmid stabilization system protein ParE